MRNEFYEVYLLLGSNMGDRMAHLAQARDLIAERIGAVTLTSHFYETQAWGKTEQADFINQAIAVETLQSPQEVLKNILQIEQDLGRTRTEKWESRTIDIDIALFDDKIVDDSDLQIPHPQLPQRNFALVPLMEIAGDVIHPVLNIPIEDVYMACKDPLDVVILDEL